jgi:hypothetical protein
MIQHRQQRLDRLIDLLKTEKALITQPRQDPALGHEHATFDFGFLSRQRLPVMRTIQRR